MAAAAAAAFEELALMHRLLVVEMALTPLANILIFGSCSVPGDSQAKLSKASEYLYLEIASTKVCQRCELHNGRALSRQWFDLLSLVKLTTD